MSNKNFVSADDAEQILTPYAAGIKSATPIELTYEQWQQLTPAQQNSGNYIVTNYPGAGGGSNVQPDWNEADASADDYIKNKPTKVSDFTNDSGFITKAVNDLTNYYNKTNSYSKTEVDTIISNVKNGRFEVVAALPTTDIKTNVIYLVPSADPQSSNVKDEYINLDGTTTGWELIGSTAIDLSNYVQKSQTAGLLKNDGSVDTNTYAKTSDLGTAAAKDSTTSVTQNSGDLVTSGGVYQYVDTMITQALTGSY